jgi:tRNA U38,U39,U40 pseudouridine synthase TruA
MALNNKETFNVPMVAVGLEFDGQEYQGVQIQEQQ